MHKNNKLLILLHLVSTFLVKFGPENPFRTQQMAAPRNMLSGYAEPAHINDFMFEQQRRTFATYGKSLTVEFPSIFIILRLDKL